jgi:hypothetical protein
MSDIVTTPLSDPATAAWDVPISSEDYSKLLAGFSPEEMEQKWAMAADTPDAAGATVLHIVRSWTGNEQFSVKLDPTKISEIQWSKSGPFDEAQAKNLAKALCRGWLDCKLEALN